MDIGEPLPTIILKALERPVDPPVAEPEPVHEPLEPAHDSEPVSATA